jgi:hypothetical protein
MRFIYLKDDGLEELKRRLGGASGASARAGMREEIDDERSVKERMSSAREREAMKRNVEEETETRQFWGQFFGQTSLVTSFLTKVSMLGGEYSAIDFNSGNFWKDVEACKGHLEGTDMEDKVVSHRMNSVEKIEEALGRGERQIEMDIRMVEGQLCLAHDADVLMTQDHSLKNALDLLVNYPEVELTLDIKEFAAAEPLVRELSARSMMGRCRFYSFNPDILTYIAEKDKTQTAPVVLSYFPLSAAPLSVSALANLVGNDGMENIARTVDLLHPSDLYGEKASFHVNESWSEIRGKAGMQEKYCAWDEYPPLDLIRKLQEGGREVWVSVPAFMMFDGLKDWANSHNVKISVYGADGAQDVGDIIEDGDVDSVTTKAAEEIDRIDGGLED